MYISVPSEQPIRPNILPCNTSLISDPLRTPSITNDFRTQKWPGYTTGFVTEISTASDRYQCLRIVICTPLPKILIMKKVILLSDEAHLPDGIFRYACMLNELQPILLTGVFISRADQQERERSLSMGGDTLIANNAIKAFETLCVRNNIDFRVHEHSIVELTRALKTETRFADLLLYSNEGPGKEPGDDILYEYMQQTAHYAECPVLIVPERFHRIENVILAYDGSSSSVFAIKQFAVSLPELTNLETLLVCISTDKGLPDKRYIEELAARHFNRLTIFKADIEPKNHFTRWLEDQSKTLLVAGAFGRNLLSSIFRESFISGVLSAHQMPVFVAHR